MALYGAPHEERDRCGEHLDEQQRIRYANLRNALKPRRGGPTRAELEIVGTLIRARAQMKKRAACVESQMSPETKEWICKWKAGKV